MASLPVEDRISELPDSLLCYILSFMPTKYAVRTSALSPRWNRVWASVPVLDLDESSFSGSKSFELFVRRVLYFCNSSGVQKFTLNYGYWPKSLSEIDGWVRIAIMHKLVELDLHVSDLSLLLIETNPKHGLMEKLVDGCPALEELAVTGSVWEENLGFNISVLELMKLTIHLATYIDNFIEYVSRINVNVYVRAPKLEYFDLQQTVLSSCVLENSESLVKASIDPTDHNVTEHPTFAGPATALLAQICNLKSLSLSAHSLDAKLLKRSSNLESLVLEQVRYGCGIEKTKIFLHPPELVPNCLLSHIKTICIIRFRGMNDEFEVAKYLLKNGEVLNSMKIYTDGDVGTKKLEKILKFERGSKTCKVEICRED
ncbi:hypothetical protein ACLB2K_005506 [Fragaria x ananassa]